MTRRPTPKQIDLLTEVQAGHVVGGPRGGWFSTMRDPSFANVKAGVEALDRNGWVEAVDDGTRPTPVLHLTTDGLHALTDARALAEYAALPADWRGVARVTRRPLGSRTYGSGRAYGDGRNVSCRGCYDVKKAAREAGARVEVTGTVWYTNESGRESDRDAEVALARHVLAHYRGELPTPSRENTEATS